MAELISNPWLWFFVGQLLLLVLIQTIRIQRMERERRGTLRDEFAAKAMQAFLSGHIAHYGHDNHWPYAQLASEACDMADAMLKARQA